MRVCKEVRELWKLACWNGPVSGIDNCHVPGVRSMTYRERVSAESGRIRVYWAGQDHQLHSLLNDTRDNYRVLPHNHSRTLKLVLLWGRVFNVIGHPVSAVDRDAGYTDGQVYSVWYNSPLVGGDGTFTRHLTSRPGMYPGTVHPEFKMQWVQLMRNRPQIIYPYQFHTMVVASRSAAWMVSEGRLAPEGHVPTAWSLNSAAHYTPKRTPAEHDVAMYCPMPEGLLLTLGSMFREELDCQYGLSKGEGK